MFWRYDRLSPRCKYFSQLDSGSQIVTSTLLGNSMRNTLRVLSKDLVPYALQPSLRLGSTLRPTLHHIPICHPHINSTSRVAASSSSSSHSLMDFFRAPPSPSKASQLALLEARQTLLQVVRDRQLSRLKSAYNNYMHRRELACRYHSSQGIEDLTPEEMVGIMQVLSGSSRMADHSLLQSMIEDSAAVFQHENQKAHHQVMLHSLVNTKQHQRALDYVDKLEIEGIDYDPKLWSILLSGLQQSGDVGGLRQAMVHFRKSRGQPVIDPYATYVEALFDIAESSQSRPDMKEITEILDEVKGLRLGRTSLLWSKLLLGYMKCGMMDMAQDVDRLIESEHKSNGLFSPTDPENQPLWNAYIQFHRKFGGPSETQTMTKALKMHGFVPTEVAVQSWLQGAGSKASISELSEAERCLGVPADEASWALLINNALKTGPSGVDEAVNIYREALKAIRPTVSLTFHLLDHLCRPDQSHRTLNPALEIYGDLIAEERDSKITTFSSHPLSISLYSTILQALADPQSRTRRPKSSIIMSIIKDMKDRSLYLDDQQLVVLAPQLMQRVKSHESLLDLYRQIRSLNPSSFTVDVYTKVLDLAAISSFPFPGSRIIPFKLYFQIVQDMTEEGHLISSAIYEKLFQSYRGKLVVPVSHPINTAILSDIRGAHSLLRLDASVTPSSQLFNIIMDAYSRAGDFEAALSIWSNDMWPSRTIDQRSVSIIIDTCGWHREKQLAFKIWSKLRASEAKGSLSLDMKSWESWIECLCRLGCFEEAKRTVVVEMGSPQSRGQTAGSPSPPFANAVVVDILMTFAKTSSSAYQESLRASIEHLLPDVYIEWSELSVRKSKKF